VRSFSLPQNVDAAGIKASAKDGVLTVVIPKVEEQKPQAQEIAIE
jgi:HSP20 family protein